VEGSLQLEAAVADALLRAEIVRALLERNARSVSSSSRLSKIDH
jgi:hypothetical protein